MDPDRTSEPGYTLPMVDDTGQDVGFEQANAVQRSMLLVAGTAPIGGSATGTVNDLRTVKVRAARGSSTAKSHPLCGRSRTRSLTIASGLIAAMSVDARLAACVRIHWPGGVALASRSSDLSTPADSQEVGAGIDQRDVCLKQLGTAHCGRE